jgi:hypothetical protein
MFNIVKIFQAFRNDNFENNDIDFGIIPTCFANTPDSILSIIL